MHDHHGHRRHHEHHEHDKRGQHQGAADRSQTQGGGPERQSSKEILVDAANVAFTNHNEPNAKGSVENVLKMRQALVDLGYHPIFIADAALKYGVDQPDQLNQLEQEGRILQAPAGTQADYFLLSYARRENLPIVSNDVFRDRRDEFPDAFNRRVPFMIVDGQVILDRERLPHQQQQAES